MFDSVTSEHTVLLLGIYFFVGFFSILKKYFSDKSKGYISKR